MVNASFAERLQQAMNLRNLKSSQIEKISEHLFKEGKIKKVIKMPLITDYLKGRYEAKQNNIYSLALILNVDEAWLMGADVPMERKEDERNKEIFSIALSSISKKTIPLLGVVKAGYDYLADENIIGNETIDNVIDIENYYALQVTGDSMEPLFSNGDVAIVHKQDTFESGNTCIILINGDEATVKKVVKTEDGIDLIAMNPYYPVRHFSANEMKNIPVKIIGKVIEARKRKVFE